MKKSDEMVRGDHFTLYSLEKKAEYDSERWNCLCTLKIGRIFFSDVTDFRKHPNTIRNAQNQINFQDFQVVPYFLNSLKIIKVCTKNNQKLRRQKVVKNAKKLDQNYYITLKTI